MITRCNKHSQKLQESGLRDEAYSAPCPYCGAAPGENCRSGGRVYWGVHRSRRSRQEFKPIPQCVAWWKSVKYYENHKRNGYVVPSQAQLLRGAA